MESSLHRLLRITAEISRGAGRQRQRQGRRLKRTLLSTTTTTTSHGGSVDSAHSENPESCRKVVSCSFSICPWNFVTNPLTERRGRHLSGRLDSPSLWLEDAVNGSVSASVWRRSSFLSAESPHRRQFCTAEIPQQHRQLSTAAYHSPLGGHEEEPSKAKMKRDKTELEGEEEEEEEKEDLHRQNDECLRHAESSQAEMMKRENVILVSHSDTPLGQTSKLQAHLRRQDGVLPLHRSFSLITFAVSPASDTTETTSKHRQETRQQNGSKNRCSTSTAGRQETTNGEEMAAPELLMLLTKRAATKLTFPSLWTNTCCSHPLFVPEEMGLNNYHRFMNKQAGKEVLGEDGQNTLHSSTGGEAPNEEEVEGNLHAVKRKTKQELGLNFFRAQEGDEPFFLTRVHYIADDPKNPVWGEHEMDYIFTSVHSTTPYFSANPVEVAEAKWVSIEETEMLLKTQPENFTPWSLLIFKRVVFPLWRNLNGSATERRKDILKEFRNRHGREILRSDAIASKLEHK